MSAQLTSALELYRQARDYSISFSFRGSFVDDLTHRILEITENSISDKQGLTKVNRKVSFLLVECFQNIIKHGNSAPDGNSDTDDGLFHFRNSGDVYVINSINKVKNSELQELVSTVDYLNTLDRDELKRIYRDKLETGPFSAKGGAGLGLLEIARKSGQKLEYFVEQIDDEVSHFHQQILFVRGDENTVQRPSISIVGEHYEVLAKHDIQLQYKGDFSQKSILPLLTFVEVQMEIQNQDKSITRKVGHVLIEALQNISKHGLDRDGQREGIFIVGKQQDKMVIFAANVVSPESHVMLSEKLDYLLSLSDEDLKVAHREHIRASVNFDDKSSSGLGLMEIARISADRLNYRFDRLDDDHVFFSLQVKV